MAEQGNTTDTGPQQQETTHQQPAREPWWKDHVRQLVVGTGRTPPPPPGPPAWALQHVQPAPLPPPPLPQPQLQPQPLPEPEPPTKAEAESPAESPAETPALPEPELKGYTNALPIASILEFLSVNRQSGTLYLTNTEETFSLEILEGDIVHASSDRSGDEQLLGSILVARDNIGTEQLEEFYKRFSPNADPNKAGNYEELVSREDLKLALEAQVQELFNRLYAADDCSFCFYEGETSGVEQRIRLNVTRLLLESARNLDELERPDEAVETPQEEEQAADEPPSELESFDEAGDFDDTVPFDGGPGYGAFEPSEDLQPLDDTPPFDDTTPFDSPVPTEHTEYTEFKQFEGSVEEGDEFDGLVGSEELDMADELDPADQRDMVP